MTMGQASEPTESYFPEASAADWAAYCDGYADLVGDLFDVDADPTPVLRGPSSSRAPLKRGVPSRGPEVDRTRPLVLAR